MENKDESDRSQLPAAGEKVMRSKRVLWQKDLARVTGNPINQLIKTVLIEDHSGEPTFTHDACRLLWLLANEFELVFVVAYQRSRSSSGSTPSSSCRRPATPL